VTDNRRALVRYRVEQADESVDSARLLLENGKLRPSVNGAYYAMFYGVLALVSVEGRAPAKHSGAVALFDSEFVKTELFGRDMSRWLHEAFDLRQRTDYRELFSVSEERTRATLRHAEQFVSAVKAYLRGRSWLD
jgi:uncharacterized protein (UPF0332 family)